MDMLSVFPQLLFLTPLSPTLLRITLGLVLAYIILVQWQRRERIAQNTYLFVPGGMWIVWTVVLLEGATALALVTGYRTQIAALVAGLFAIKFFIWHARYPEMFPLSRIASLLLLAVAISLLMTGGGLYGIDLPL